MLSTRHRVAFAAAALAATLLAPFGANAAQEKTVVYYENIKGFLAMPGNSVKSPALILMHDFGGLNDEMRSGGQVSVHSCPSIGSPSTHT